MDRIAGLLEDVGAVFGFCHEQIPGKGEDSWCYRFHERGGVLAVFDGCGGLGAESYARLGNAKGAYLSSRAVSAATIGWFESQPMDQRLDVAALKARIDEALRICEQAADRPQAKLRGAMVRSFPTTMAACVLQRIVRGTFFSVLSAGDSRVYHLDSAGLKQVSHDDLAGEDAFSNLYHDAPMTNVISSDGAYTLSMETYELRGPCVLFAATDGCFGYLKSPMEFELLLLEALDDASSIDEWQANLERRIDSVAGDDQTLAALVYGHNSFRALKKSLVPRRKQLGDLLANMPDDLDARRRVWNSYKQGYYSLLPGGAPEL